MESRYNWKLPKKNQLVILMLIGVLLVVIAMPAEMPGREEQTEQKGEEVIGETYEKLMETRLERILREVEGVGTVKVMITLQTSSEKVVEKDQEENKEITIYNSASGGEQTPYVKKEINPQIEGVVVIAEGGADAMVVKNIIEAVQALFDVDTHKIKIMKRNQTN